jgi:hypothetical protein
MNNAVLRFFPGSAAITEMTSRALAVFPPRLVEWTFGPHLLLDMLDNPPTGPVSE